MIITSVERNKKNREKLAVYIDDRYSFSIAEEDYLRLNLYEKKEITGEAVEDIRNTVIFSSAKSTALKYLLLKLRSAGEVRRKLESEGYDEGTTENVIEELKAMGYINDKIYAQKYLFDRSKLKPKSKRMIRFELQSRGIGEEIIDEVLGAWDVDEGVVAEGLVRKKFGKYDLRDQRVIKKIYAFLHHRGYNFEVIDGVVRKMGCDDE